MKRERFPLTSDQLELLLAFEAAEGLNRLSETLGKDPSVISRNLQRLAESLPVIVKQSGKWQISELGRQVNRISREFLKEFERHLPEARDQIRRSETKSCFSKRALLVVINAQQGLHDPTQGHRNNSDAEENVLKLLQHWRKQKKPIVHVKHVSDNPASLFYKVAEGVKFIPALAPLGNEPVLEKSKASAFSGTALEELIRSKESEAIVLAGFTAGECIDATARQASDLGLTGYVVADATATFDITGPDGVLHKAERVHKLVLANLHTFFAEVMDTEALLKG